MKLSHNLIKYEVLIKQYTHSILYIIDIRGGHGGILEIEKQD